MKTLTPEQREQGFLALQSTNKDAHLLSFLAGIRHAEEILGEEPKTRGPLTTKEIMHGLDNLPLPVCHYSRGGTFGEGVAYAERMHGIVPCEAPEPEPEPETKGEPAAIMAVRSWGDDKDYYFKPLMEDLPIGEYELHLKPKVPFVRLTDKELENLGGKYVGPMSDGEFHLMVITQNALEEKNK